MNIFFSVLIPSESDACVKNFSIIKNPLKYNIFPKHTLCALCLCVTIHNSLFPNEFLGYNQIRLNIFSNNT